MKMFSTRRLDSTIEELRKRRVKLTKPRLAVLGALAETDDFLTVEDIHTSVGQRQQIGLVSVYRALDLFVQLGIVHTGPAKTRRQYYRLCQDEVHHHHIACSMCGKVEEVPDCPIKGISQKVKDKIGFQVTAHRLELVGVCPTCSRKND